ncbi:hypothetical protein L6164_023649 [Bauhinia variegata]|uniref:Uncharacterized protein n=1 Tax=Bauhinia variegata TaxID=167791 RepID=A0ACB9MJ09_BAUVA|nr:hypothetical protein L6164_023649 [Bauhinia variegata]
MDYVFSLLSHLSFFTKRSLPVSISDTQYLHNMAGDTEIRKGYGMRLILFRIHPLLEIQVLVNSLLTLIFSKSLIS